MPEANKGKILVVDDTPANRYVVARILRSGGYQVAEAATGEEGLRKAVEGQPELVVLDVHLPDLLGFEVARRLKAGPRTARIRVLHLSASFTTGESVVEGLEAGADGYLTSPVDPKVLLATVQSLLRLRRAEVQIAELLERERAARAQADASGRYFFAIAEALPHVVWTSRPDGSVEFLNRSWAQVTGLPAEEGLGQRWQQAYHPEDLPKVLDAWDDAHRSGQPIELEVRMRGADGRYRWFLRREVPLADPEGRLVQWLGTCTDVDRHRRTEQALQSAVRSRDELLSITSHDIKTPLSTIRLKLDVLRRTAHRNPEAVSAARVGKMLDAVDAQLSGLVELLERSLEGIRIRAGKVRLQIEPVDLAAVVREAVSRAREQLTEAGCEVELDCAEPAVGRWDRLRLEQVLMNLLSNAIKYGRGQPIEVCSRVAGDLATLSVRDHGPGISPEDQRRIFDPFERAGSSGNDRAGHGVGLWSVREVVTALGGTVRVSSTVGEGSTFSVELPIAGPRLSAEWPRSEGAAAPD